jgi:hypothetical protein
MAREETMKFRFVLMSILMLLPLPSKAKDVFLQKMSVELASDIPNLDSLDAIIDTNQSMSEVVRLLNSGELKLKENEVLMISGGRGSIKKELDQYKETQISLWSANGIRQLPAMTSLGPTTNWLDIRGCYVTRPLQQNTTYIMISASTWSEPRFCPYLLLEGAELHRTIVKVSEIANAVIKAHSISAASIKFNED